MRSTPLSNLLSSVGGGETDGEGSAQPDGTVTVEGVSVSLGGERVLEDVTASVEEGEFVGLIGPNGAGKTTLLRIVSGVLAPDAGRVRVGGADVGDLSSREASRRVAVVPQDTHLAFDFDVRDVVAMGRNPYRRRVSLGPRPDEDVVDEAMARTSVDHLAGRSIGAVSGGERQRVLLARALAQDTPVLLLDEPTASLDIHHQVETLEIVRSLVAEGTTVVAAIHDLNLAAHYCDELLLLGDGRVLAQGPPVDVLTETNLEAAFGTQAVVTNHPVTGSVYVMALPAGATETTRERVHVVGGGGTGARLLYLLSAAGFAVTTGALNEGDADLETARLLGVDAVTLAPGARMDEAARDAVREYVEESAVTVVADVEVGVGNLANLEAAAAADDLVIVEKRPFEERNYAGPAARERYAALRSRARLVDESDLIPAVEAVVDDRED